MRFVAHRTLRPNGSMPTCIGSGDFLSFHFCASWRTIGHIPSHRPQNNFPLKLAPLEVHHTASLPPHAQWSSIADYPSSENLQQILDQIIEQPQLFFRQLCRAARTRLGQQARIARAPKSADPVGNCANGDAEAGCHFPIRVLARNHNQAANPQDRIIGSEAFSLCRKCLQIAQASVA
jgi:hypothetical protein